MASADYQFSRRTSIGIMATYGKVNQPYYFRNDVLPTFTGKLQNTALMLNLMNYFPAVGLCNLTCVRLSASTYPTALISTTIPAQQ